MKEEHLPIYGVGPFCVASMLLLFVGGVLLHCFGYLDSGKIERFSILMFIIGIIFIMLGIGIWIQAVIITKIERAIINNQLVTTGIYAWVRNPIYTAIAMTLIGVALLFTNLWLVLLAPLFWLDITILMKNTEEKWLLTQYGEVYLDYCQRVNRCIPWIPKIKK
ncbi:methyltransferase family protein [Faecalimonas sp.]